MKLPPRDPFEPAEPEPHPLDKPAAIFAGRPGEADQRLADAILRARPGILFVVALRG